MMKSMWKIWYRGRRAALTLVNDRNGVAAIEFAMIVPIMLVLFFGTVEFSSGIAVDRKVTLIARTFSDLVSQNTSVNDTNLSNFFSASCAIMSPYAGPPPCTPANNPTNAVISELYVDPVSHKAIVQWSKAYQGGAVRTAGTAVTTVPTSLLVDKTYLIFSEVSYLYKPTVGYVMAKAGINLSDVAYTRPRQLNCVVYPTPTSGPLPNCPTKVTP
jgi:Flp pilus assembly protein TadG